MVVSEPYDPGLGHAWHEKGNGEKTDVQRDEGARALWLNGGSRACGKGHFVLRASLPKEVNLGNRFFEH